jgi:hypothetical protein
LRWIQASLSALVPGSAQWKSCWPLRATSMVSDFPSARAASSSRRPMVMAVSLVNSRTCNSSSCRSSVLRIAS